MVIGLRGDGGTPPPPTTGKGLYPWDIPHSQHQNSCASSQQQVCFYLMDAEFKDWSGFLPPLGYWKAQSQMSCYFPRPPEIVTCFLSTRLTPGSVLVLT